MPDQQKAYEITTPRLPVRATWEGLVDGIVYADIECVMPPVHAPVQTLASPEWSSGSLPILPASLIVPLLVASPETTPATTTVVEDDEFLEAGQTEALRAPLWQARYKDQREILALRIQHAADQREMQGLKERVATLERRMDRIEGRMD
ncbi:hypothetical protein Tco_1128069 [Tanacetum coccineum]